MTDHRQRQYLLLATLVLVAQTILAWHAPSHILDHHRDVVAQHDCEILHGHGMAAPPTVFIAPPVPCPTVSGVAPTVAAPRVALLRAHPARAPPALS